MANEQQQDKNADRGRPSTVVVTSENLAEFQARRLGLEAPTAPDAKDDAKAKGADAKDDAEGDDRQEGVDDEHQDDDAAGKEQRQGKLNRRFSELTHQRKQAETERDAAREEARREREARLAAEARLAKPADAPAKGDEANETPPADANQDPPRPERSKFKAGAEGDEEYQDAVADWRLDVRDAKRQREEAKRKATEAIDARKRKWQEATTAVMRDIPDYQEAINKAKDVTLSNVVTEALHD